MMNNKVSDWKPNPAIGLIVQLFITKQDASLRPPTFLVFFFNKDGRAQQGYVHTIVPSMMYSSFSPYWCFDFQQKRSWILGSHNSGCLECTTHIMACIGWGVAYDQSEDWVSDEKHSLLIAQGRTLKSSSVVDVSHCKYP